MTQPNEQLIDVVRIRERLDSAHLIIAKFGADGEKTVAYQSMDDVRALLEENKRLREENALMGELISAPSRTITGGYTS